MASTGNAKALIGAIFLQYCSYAIFYILDELNTLSPSHYKALVSEQEAPPPKEEDPPLSSGRKSKKKAGASAAAAGQKKPRNQDEGQYEGGDKKNSRQQ